MKRTYFVGHLPNKMDTHKLWWQWKTMVIDFEKYPDTRSPHHNYGWVEGEKKFTPDGYKLHYGLHYAGFPDLGIHSWYNGGYSSEYNEALNYLLDLGLIEIFDDELDNL